MQDDNSDLFKVEPSKEIHAREMHFFNKDTEIIKEGQRHNVIRGLMEEEKKTLHEIVSPYLHQFAATTAEIAARAGSTTYETLKMGFIWVYNKFVNNVIPYAVETLPKLIFVTKKEENIDRLKSSIFQVLVDEEDYNRIPKKNVKEGTTNVVVNMGTQDDEDFKKYLKGSNYKILDYTFPIDSSDEIAVKQSFMIPSESFMMIAETVNETHLQLRVQDYKRVAFKLDKCFIFEFQGQNTIEYDMDMLDAIQRDPDVKVGYIVAPQQTLRRSISDSENDPISRLVNGKEEIQEEIIEKQVDMTRNVKVEIANRKPKPEYQLALN